MSIQTLRQRLEQQKGKRMQLAQSLVSLKQMKVKLVRSLHRHEEAHEILKTVGIATQQQLQFHISNITSLALEAVFDEPYSLEVKFVERRNKTECDLLFARDGSEMDPLTASGGGAVDVAAFALRIASWSMAHPRSRPVIVLDEPFKHLKGAEANLRVLNMINEISREMHIQIIMISDERIPREDIIAAADKVFEVSIKKGKSKVIEL